MSDDVARPGLLLALECAEGVLRALQMEERRGYASWGMISGAEAVISRLKEQLPDLGTPLDTRGVDSV